MLGLLLFAAASACSAAPEPPPTRHGVTQAAPSAPRSRPAVDPAPEPFPVPAGEPAHRRVLSQRFQLSIPLPDRPGWLLVRDKSSFLVMDHAATRSRLVARIWQEAENMSRQRCEEVARLIRDVPVNERVIDERVIDVPRGFDTAVSVGFAAAGPGEPITGQVLAFGASARWCFAFVYTTRATGPGAERAVGDRLAVIQGLTLEGIERRLATDIELR